MFIFYTVIICTFAFYNIPTLNLNANKVKVNVYTSLVFIFLTILGSIRFNVGADYMNYYKYFKNGILDIDSYEPGYVYLNRLVYSFTNNTQMIFIVTTLLIMLFFYLSIERYSINTAMSTFLFFFGFFYFDSLSAIRQYIAVVIVLYSHKYLYTQKYKYFLCIIIASSFHYSAIFTLIMLLLKDKKIKSKEIISMYALIIIFNIFSSSFLKLIFSFFSEIKFLSKYSVYQDMFIGNMQSKPYDFIVYSSILVLTHLISNKSREKHKFYNLYRNNLLIAIFLKGIGLNFKMFDRLAIYFGIFIILYIPIIFKEMEIKEKKIILYGMHLCYILYCFMRIYSGQAGVYDYTTIFEK